MVEHLAVRSGAYARSVSVALACAVASGIWAPALGLGAEGSAQSPPYELDLRFANGLVSANMIDVPLVEAVTELARGSGFRLVVEGGIDRQVTLSRTEVKVSEFLDELLHSCSWFAIFGPDEAGEGTKLSEVRVLRSPGCDGSAGTGRAVSANESAMRVQSLSGSFATIDKDDLAQRKQYLNRVINGQARASVDELVETARDPRDASLQMLSLMALGRTGGLEAKAALVEALSDDNVRTRGIAVRSLAQGWGEEAVPTINGLLSTETEPPVIQFAVQQLGTIGTDAAWDGLRRAADSDDPQVSAIAKKALGFYEELEKRTNKAR